MIKEKTNCSLRAYNTFGLDVRADRFFEYDTVEDLQQVVHRVRAEKTDKPLLHIGGGSNLLFLGDYHGIVLHSAIQSVEVCDGVDSVVLRVGAAVVWDDFVAYCVEHGYYGVENLSLIPGEVGASAVQNVGAYGAEAKDVIEKVETVDLRDGSIRVFEASECRYAYRRSIFKEDLKGHYAVTYVSFRLSRRFTPNLDYGGVREALWASGIENGGVTAQAVRKAVISIREAKLPDPKVWGNAGSFFMNPIVERGVFEKLKAEYPDMPHFDLEDGTVKVPAGWLIEWCGWKGRSLGRAAVHDKQALVLVNKGGATGREIMDLCKAVQADVYDKFGIYIRPEVNIIGEEV